MKNIYLPAFLAAFLMFSGCIDEIQLDIDSDIRYLAVDGMVTDSLQDQRISVYYSAVLGFGSDNVKDPVTGATVRVVDGDGNAWDFEESQPGLYVRRFRGIPGQSYLLELRLPDGKDIRSRPARLPASPRLEAPTLQVTQSLSVSSTGRSIYEYKLSVGMNTDVGDLPEKPYLRWRATGEYEFGEDYPGIMDRKICYIPHNIDFNKIKVFDTHTLADGRLFDEPFLQLKYDYRFAFQYCLSLYQFAISEAEYRYWEQVRDIVNIDGSLFDPPPGTVTGNLYNPADPNEVVLGYFSVAGVRFRREFLNAVTVGTPIQPRCSPAPFRPQYPECRDCRVIPFSSVERPPYWFP